MDIGHSGRGSKGSGLSVTLRDPESEIRKQTGMLGGEHFQISNLEQRASLTSP